MEENKVADKQTGEYTYASWRTDQEAKPGFSRELIHHWNTEHPDTCQPQEYNGCKTLRQLFEKIVKDKPENPFLGTRNTAVEGKPYEWRTFKQVHEMVELLAKGIQALGLTPDILGDGEVWNFMGIFAKNREEWAMVDLACMISALTIVPFYDSLGMEALALVINLTELTTMCIERINLELLCKLKETQCASLQHLILFGEATPEEVERAKQIGLSIHTFSEVLKAGQANQQVVLKEPETDSTYMFCFTSGTTGDAKEARESHGSFLADMYLHDASGMNITDSDIHISYLPLAHVYEQLSFVKSICTGYSFGFYGGDALKLFEDMAVLKPTLFFTVPRILNKLYSIISSTVVAKGGNLSTLFEEENFKVWDGSLFLKFREMLGGRIRLIVTGAAPIHADVLTFLKAVFKCPIHEGYGQTEGLVLTLNHADDRFSVGTVGGPTPNTKIRLRDIPEMSYLSTDLPNPRGELQYHGTTTFKGYFKMPEKTAEAINDDGWINSGDVAVILPNGAIKIIDRAKNIFKLAQGEYVAPEKLENIYVQCSTVAQIFVYGDSLQAYLVAVVVPDPDQIKSIPQDEIGKAVLAQLDQKATEYKLSGIEKIKKVHISPVAFTAEQGLLTPTFKLKRFHAKNYFKAEIDLMYSTGL